VANDVVEALIAELERANVPLLDADVLKSERSNTLLAVADMPLG